MRAPSKTVRLVMPILLLPWLTACSYLNFWGDDAEEPVGKDPASEADKALPGVDPVSNIRPATLGELELKLAKLWSRVDQLEEQNYRHKEKIRVLEKGLMLGLVPEELKRGRPEPVMQPVPPPPPPAPPQEAAPKKSPAEGKAEFSKEEREKYQTMLANAHDYFRSGRYGRAIKEYSAIGEEFGPKIADGMHKYWIARGWANLKEYSMAHQRYVEFLKEYPASPWIPRAKLDMARLELKQGLRETAIEHFKTIIQEYPYEDAAEMAKMELSNLESTL